MKHVRFLLLVFLTLWCVNLYSQGTSGTLIGTVTSDGNPLPGATITISSQALQGTRTAVSGENGGYYFPALPPGNYTVVFTLEGMQTVRRTVSVGLAQTSRADAGLRVSAMAEAVTVTASAPAVVETTEVSANFDSEAIRELPTGRDIREMVLLAPGVTEAAVNNQITISGAMSFENLFLVNGVVVNENLRGQPNELFIEDAVKETTVLTGGVSAEYGRFTGGVVSTITKSGGNDLSGSLRDSIANPSWTEKTAYAAQVDPLNDMNHTYEATLGGPMLRDRLWFFGAGRFENRNTRLQLRLTEIPYIETRDNKRYEGKLTGQVTQKHNLVLSYLKSNNDHNNIITFGPVVDLRSLTTRTQPKTLLGINYNGVLTSSLFIEGQFSRMTDRLARGAETRDLIEGTLLRDSSSGNRMWSPSGCGTPCGMKHHDNKSWLAKSSYFLSTQNTGSHTFAGGVEEFHQLRNDNNFQSGSDFWIHGHIIQDPANLQNLYFGIEPSDGAIEWDSVPALSQTSDFAMRSAFINDKWDLNNKWNFSVGLRYDNSFGKNQAGTKTVDDSAFSPRLAMHVDPTGKGRHRFSATYGRYVARIDQGPADQTASAGRYAYYLFDYAGPVINPKGTPISQIVPTPLVIKQIFDWFNSVGGVHNSSLLSDVSVPGYTYRFEHSINSPYMDEISAGYSISMSHRSFVRADYITRKWDSFYAFRRTLDTGKVTDPTGAVLDQGVIENSSGGLERNYHAIQLQANYQPLNRLSVGGNYTWSKLRGNVEGETPSGATSITDNPDQPEYRGFAQYNPVGYLLADMRHRGNVWVRYDIPTAFGAFNLSLLERYHSALSYSATSTIDVRKGVTNGPANGVVNPGYSTVPSSVRYYFSDRGAYRVDNIKSTSLGLNYTLPVRSAQLFFEGDVLNIFNEQGVEDPDSVNQTVLTRRSTACLQTGSTTRCLAFNPLVGDVPKEGVNFQKGPLFGQPVTQDAYQQPRTYRFSVGMRF